MNFHEMIDATAKDLKRQAVMEAGHDNAGQILQAALMHAGENAEQLLAELQAIASKSPAHALLMAAAAGRGLGDLTLREGVKDARDAGSNTFYSYMMVHFRRLMRSAATVMLHQAAEGQAEHIHGGTGAEVLQGLGALWLVQATTWGDR